MQYNELTSFIDFQDDPVPDRERELAKSLVGVDEGRKVRTFVPGKAPASGGSPTLSRRASEVRTGMAGSKKCFILKCFILLKNGPNLASFCLFLFFSLDKYSANTINDKSIDGVLGTRIWGGIKVGGYESTELWRQPLFMLYVLCCV